MSGGAWVGLGEEAAFLGLRTLSPQQSSSAAGEMGFEGHLPLSRRSVSSDPHWMGGLLEQEGDAGHRDLLDRYH